jgi:hypothetical protein
VHDTLPDDNSVISSHKPTSVCVMTVQFLTISSAGLAASLSLPIEETFCVIYCPQLHRPSTIDTHVHVALPKDSCILLPGELFRSFDCIGELDKAIVV